MKFMKYQIHNIQKIKLKPNYKIKPKIKIKMNLCKYKNIFGIPKQGIHSWRIFDVAMADVVMTIIGAVLISYFTKIPLIYCLIGFFLLGIILHRMFCVKTTVDRWIFG